MNKVLITSILLTFSIASNAQTFERLKDNNLWNRSNNVTGIAQDRQDFSNAELYGGYQAGDFREYGQSESEWYAGISTESIRHIGKLSFTGRFAFEQRQGHKMYGSMFIKPGRYPIDVLEFTPGNKNLQNYSVSGGLSYDTSENWRIGIMADFKAANYAKRKDLRHTNFMLDFGISPAFMWHNDDLAAGFSATVGKNAETIKGEVIGTSESTYYAFFDKGLMYGLYEGWEGSGIHLKEAGVNGLPVKEFFTGAAAQLSVKGFFAEISYRYSKGKIGEKDYIWYEFPANTIAAQLAYRHQSGNGTHFIRLAYEGMMQTNIENILEKVSQNGVNAVVNHGSNTILDRNIHSLCPEYEYVGNIWEIRWRARGELDNEVSTQMYPLAIQQNIFQIHTDVSSIVHLGKFDVRAGIGFVKGWFNEKERISGTISGNIVRPVRIDEYYRHTVNYLEASKIDASVMGRWKFYKGLYIKIQGGCLANLGDSEDKLRWRAGLTLGYDF